MPVLTPGTMSGAFDIRAEGADTVPSQTVTIAPSQSIKRGDWLIKSSGADTFEQALALPGSNNTVTVSSGNLATACIASEDITTNSSGIEEATGKTAIQAYVLGPHVRAYMQAFNATASDAQRQDFSLTTGYNLGRWRGASASVWAYCITTGTTNPEVYLVEADPRWAATDTYPAFWSRIAVSETVQAL